MTVYILPDGTIIWKFYRKTYRKTRWRYAAQRQINHMKKHYPENEGWCGMILVI